MHNHRYVRKKLRGPKEGGRENIVRDGGEFMVVFGNNGKSINQSEDEGSSNSSMASPRNTPQGHKNPEDALRQHQYFTGSSEYISVVFYQNPPDVGDGHSYTILAHYTIASFVENTIKKKTNDPNFGEITKSSHLENTVQTSPMLMEALLPEVTMDRNEAKTIEREYRNYGKKKVTLIEDLSYILRNRGVNPHFIHYTQCKKEEFVPLAVNYLNAKQA